MEPRRLPFILIALLLAGCEGRVSVDLTNERPADASLRQVVSGLDGLEFERSDGTTEQVTFTASESVNLNGFQNGRVLTLLTDETLPEGTYTGVRLLFDTDADGRFVTDSLSRRYTMLLATGDYAEFDFVVEKDKSSRKAITLTLDLRQSLSLDSSTGVFTLTPFLRSVVTDEAGILEGTVSVTCGAGVSLAQGGTAYLYRGLGVVPDDRDGIGVEPYATAALSINTATGQFSYRLLDLPAGDYTLAVTCEGSLENPSTNDILVFHGTRNVRVDEAAVSTANVTD